MTSIRKRLLVSILSTIILVTALLAIATYFAVREEMDELYDENMKQVAMVLARTGLEDDHSVLEEASENKKLKGEEEFLIQIWREGKIAYTSHPAINFALQKEGRKNFGRAIFEENKWRYYQLKDKNDIIQVSQALDKRHDVVKEIYRVLVVPILIQMPVLITLIWFLVGYGFKPLMLVSDHIKKRTAAFLEPLSVEKSPIEVRELLYALNDLLVRLKSSMDAQRSFTSDAAHELRTPLTAIGLQLDILKRASNAEEKEEAINSLDKGINRSIRLAQQLLELARQEPESITHPLTRISLNDVIKEAIEQGMTLSQMKSISLTFDLDQNLSIEGNAAQLGVMIGNLINNAIIYTPEQGNVKVIARKTDHQIFVDVSDDGIGIGTKDKERVFDRFYRVAGTGAIGSGLGLSIVKNIAAFHKIDIAILEGINNKGTTFRLLINSV
ncbi:MAG: hypothetical protein DI586_03585 [Micavibrio aeruginosavorus]|uniref:histidine kinase n=1 Tax=Micavibrio aeruginosavorus TaxID=349221 RepID=A0A2W5FQ04_9BACT|nr:MAG: hypothetical protein DI586_03585 [Micavibrio aeruginosavorus]